jgi:putative nucleotidyltransferase with HDIG domain
LLYVLGAWLALSVLIFLVLVPLLRVASAEPPRAIQRAIAEQRRRAVERPRGLAEPSRTGVPSPQRLGYSGVILQRLAQHARTVLGVHSAWIAISPPGAPERFRGAAAAGADPDIIGRLLSSPCEDLGGLASAPIAIAGSHRGELCVGRHVNGGELSRLDVELLDELATLTGEVLAHHESRELFMHDTEDEIRALVRSMAEADGDTYRHSLEVAATARAVATKLGLEHVDLVEVELGALLHDLGKLRMPRAILRKAGPLDADELRVMRSHPEWGCEMVAHVPGLEAVALIVRLHHERPDGTGYPHGLTDERIPMASKIVSACDAYGAMTRRRDYSEPLDVDAALQELELNSGTQFDPLVVEVLANFVREPIAAAGAAA